MKKKLILPIIAIINLISVILIYMFHHDMLDSGGIEAIRQLELLIFIPSVILLITSSINFKYNVKFIQFFGLLSLSITIYIMSVHSGARTGVSIFEHPQYIFSILSSIALIVFSDLKIKQY